jgi:hypothetical protein
MLFTKCFIRCTNVLNGITVRVILTFWLVTSCVYVVWRYDAIYLFSYCTMLPDSLGSSPILRLGGHPSFIFGKIIRISGVGRRDSKRKVRTAAIKGGGGE